MNKLIIVFAFIISTLDADGRYHCPTCKKKIIRTKHIERTDHPRFKSGNLYPRQELPQLRGRLSLDTDFAQDTY